MKDINYNKTDFLSEEVIYYHKILYKRYLDRLNTFLVKNNHNFSIKKESIVNNLEMFPIEDRGNILFNLGGVLNHELYQFFWSMLSLHVKTGNRKKYTEAEISLFISY